MKRGKTLDSDSWVMCPGEETTDQGSYVDGSVSPSMEGNNEWPSLSFSL